MATILVVDDRVSNRQLMTTLLSYSGHRLLEAGNGVEALYQLHEHRPDLLITDILMPTMDGYDLVQQLRADPELAELPVIFHTASYSPAEARALAETCGVRHVLPKPCEPEKILATVSEALGIAEIPRTASAPRRDLGAFRALRGPAGPFRSYVAELESVGRTVDRLLAGIGPESGAARMRSIQMSTQAVAQFARLRRIAADVSTLIKVELDLAAQQDPQQLAEQFFDAACDAIASRIAALGVIDSDETMLGRVVAKGIDPGLLIRGAPESAFLGSLVAGGSAIRRKAGQPVSPDEGMPPEHPSSNSVLGVTIASAGRVLGWLYFADRPGVAGFSEDEERLATVLAMKFGANYENAMHYDVIQKHAAQLQIDAASFRPTGRTSADAAASTAIARDAANKDSTQAADVAPGSACKFLTKRELEVVKHVVAGKSNAEAGAILGLSPRSVETYRGRLMQKLGFHDLPALVKFAIRHGITPLD